MPNPVTTVEFRFDREHCSKDGMLFQGPMQLLALPDVGEIFELDHPVGFRARILRKEVRTLDRFTEIILHCELEPELTQSVTRKSRFRQTMSSLVDRIRRGD